MELAMAGSNMGATFLSECAFSFFATMARLFKDEFVPYLDLVVKRLFQSCQQQEVEDNLDDDEGDLAVDGDPDHLSGYRINSAIAEEKEIAVDALGVIFEFTKSHFTPYLQVTLQTLQELSDHTHEDVRKSCVVALFKVLVTLWVIHHENVTWSAGLPPAYATHPDVQHIIKIVMDESMRYFDEEEDKAVVVTLCQELMEALNAVGPVLVASHIDALCQHILSLLERKATCQIELGEEEIYDPEEDEAELDALVISSAIDLIGSLAQSMAHSFPPFFKHFWPHLSKYYKPNKPVSDRSMAVGVIGEVAAGLKGDVAPFTAVCVAFSTHGRMLWLLLF